MAPTIAETWRLPDDLAGPWLRAADLGRRIHRPKDAVVYRQGEISTLFYFVLSGQIKVSILRAGGEETILEILSGQLAHYARERQSGERFGDFVCRAGYAVPQA